MSDTPRTDAAVSLMLDSKDTTPLIEECKKLERENAQERAYGSEKHQRILRLEEIETRYYEQQAQHTEARGMLCQERDNAKRALEARREDCAVLTAKLAAREDYAGGLMAALYRIETIAGEAEHRGFDDIKRVARAAIERIDSTEARNETPPSSVNDGEVPSRNVVEGQSERGAGVSAAGGSPASTVAAVPLKTTGGNECTTADRQPSPSGGGELPPTNAVLVCRERDGACPTPVKCRAEGCPLEREVPNEPLTVDPSCPHGQRVYLRCVKCEDDIERRRWESGGKRANVLQVLKWSMDWEGRTLFDGGHRGDVKLTVDGNWEDEGERREYAIALMTKLNTPYVPPGRNSVPDSVLTGGNHLANVLIAWLGADFAYSFPPDLDVEVARGKINGSNAFDVWCCWAAIMRSRYPSAVPSTKPCPDCFGLGTRQSDSDDCPRCDGKGHVACKEKRAMTLIDLIVRDVAELPDRDSPEDQPEMMMVTDAELRAIVAARVFGPLGDNHHNAAECPHCSHDGKFVMVPREPTDKMLNELYSGGPMGSDRPAFVDAYHGMLAVAREP